MAGVGFSVLWLVISIPALAAGQGFDVLVYGGTAGGVAAAVAAAREGAAVALLEPGAHLGGMTSGGLGATDHGRQNTIGGISLEFYQRLGRHYGEAATWYFEPHVAEEVLRQMAQEAGVKVFYRHRLGEKGGVLKSGGRIAGIVMENGAAFRAKTSLTVPTRAT